MEFNSQICTTEAQSKRLLALGLKKETADCFWISNTSSITGKTHCRIIVGEFEEDDRCVPAWSLHRLKCLLPEKTPYGDGNLMVEIINENVYIVLVIENIEQKVLKYTKGNLYDNLISCIEFFVKESHINKEYLEE